MRSPDVLLRSALALVLADRQRAETYARLFLAPDSPVPTELMLAVIERDTRSSIAQVLRGGWLPSELAAMARRRLDPEHVPELAALLTAEVDRHPVFTVAPAWRRDLSGLGTPERANVHTPTGLALRLRVLAVLHTLPGIPTIIPAPGSFSGTAGTPHGIDSKVLARVRSLLAKAESTPYSQEAEALSAKAQELISRYALDRLWLSTEQHTDADVMTSRLWIDPPYVMAKATLIGVVARANRCRTVASADLGFTTVVGEPADVQAVELLSTSLLVQASSAMLRHGAHLDRSGRSRTRSFRQSFLVSFATRIGERLAEATKNAAAATGRVGELVPVLQRQAERIDAAVEAMFPDVVSRPNSISNAMGWLAGRVAADQASLDIREKIDAG